MRDKCIVNTKTRSREGNTSVNKQTTNKQYKMLLIN